MLPPHSLGEQLGRLALGRLYSLLRPRLLFPLVFPSLRLGHVLAAQVTSTVFVRHTSLCRGVDRLC